VKSIPLRRVINQEVIIHIGNRIPTPSNRNYLQFFNDLLSHHDVTNLSAYVEFFKKGQNNTSSIRLTKPHCVRISSSLILYSDSPIVKRKR